MQLAVSIQRLAPGNTNMQSYVFLIALFLLILWCIMMHFLKQI